MGGAAPKGGGKGADKPVTPKTQTEADAKAKAEKVPISCYLRHHPAICVIRPVIVQAMAEMKAKMAAKGRGRGTAATTKGRDWSVRRHVQL